MRTRRNDSDDVASRRSSPRLTSRAVGTAFWLKTERSALRTGYQRTARCEMNTKVVVRSPLHRLQRGGCAPAFSCAAVRGVSVEPATRGAALLRQTRATRTLAHRTVRHAPLIACENCTVPPGAFAAPSLAAVRLFCGRRGQLLSDRVFSAVAKTQTRLRGRASAPARSRAAALVFS